MPGLDDKIYYKEIKYKYVTTREVTYQTCIFPEQDIETKHVILRVNGQLTLKLSYAWNGANVVKDTRTNMRASAIHDALVQLIKLGLLDKKWKIEVDFEYYRAARQDKMLLLRAIIHMAGIQAAHWEDPSPGVELIAP